MLGISSTGFPGRKFFDELVHARWSQSTSLDIYRAPSMQYLAGEPIFIGNSENGSNAGVVICQLFDAHSETAAFAIFHAFEVHRGPIATIRLPQPIPPGFHASFYRS
jgi:carotenoid cleavage dioxygenase-like enzyme